MPVRRRATAVSVCAFLALVALLGSGAETARAASPEFVSNEVIVRFRGNDAAARASVLADLGAVVEDKLTVPNAYVVRLRSGLSPAAAAILARRLDVAYAHPNYYARASTIPDDERYQQLWNLNQANDKDIDAPEAWDLTTGSSGVIVAVVDSGVAWDHPDLFPNTWANPYEVVNSRDEDRNGFVDDVRGWDWISEDNNPSDENGHGTHVAGTIGAKGNNAYGVVGVNWNVSIMHLRVLNEDGYGTFEDVADAFDYAGEKGARVVNASLSCYGCTEPTVVREAIARHPNTLYVVAAGNESASTDAKASYPCNHQIANLICVAATDANDSLAHFSNYGATHVDLAAPGVDITSTWLAYDDRFYDGFESGAKNWVTGGSNNSWQVTNARARTGSSSATDSPAGDYKNNTNSYLRLAEPLNFAGRRGCQARYSMLLAAELGWDFVWVEGSTGGAWTGLDGWTIPTEGEFVDLETDMKDFDYAPEVHFRFRFQSDDEQVADGVYFDDVRLRCKGTSYNADDFDTVSGTSMASPQVAGVAALAFARRPLATAAAVKAAILSSVDPLASLQGKVATGGRLNAQSTVAAIDRLVQAPPPTPPPATPPPPAAARKVQRVCRVPKVVGNRLAKARRRIAAGGCTVGRIQRAKSRFPGRVIRQRPAAGARRPRGAKVFLTIGRS